VTDGPHLQARPRRRGAARWLLLVALLAGMLASLFVDGLFASASSARDIGPPVFEDPASIGPVLDLAATPTRSAHGRSDTVGLALVDTGQIEPAREAAAVLAAHGSTATWFITGRTVLDRPETLDIARAAHAELGVSGFTGRDLATLPEWRVRAELATTQAVIAAGQAITTPLLLLPATAGADQLDAAAARTARTAARQGYGLVLGTAPETVAGGQVAVIPLDGRAADRLGALLDRLDSSAVTAGPVSAVAELDVDAVNAPVDRWSRANGWALVVVLRISHGVATLISLLFWPVLALLAARAAAGTLLAVVHARRRRSGPRWQGPVSVIVPAYNEVAGIEATLRSLQWSRWRAGIEVIVVDDGSTDGTAEVVERLGVRLVRQSNAGKPAALNSGLAVATTEVVVLMDGDTVFEPDTIAELVAPFADPRVGASSGNAKVINRDGLLGRWQHIEYVIGFNLDRRMLAMCHAIPTVPGAVGAFRMAALRDVGGVSSDTLAEDTDLTIAVTRAGWRVTYQDRALGWTEAPSSIGDLWRQRYRWSYGTLQAVWKHRGALAQGRGIGLIGLPYALTFQVGLALLAPFIDVAALYGAVTGGLTPVAVAWLAFTAAQLVLAGVAFRLDRESIRPLWTVPIQQVVYRQLLYLVVIQSVASAVAGSRLRWHKLRRIGPPDDPHGPSRLQPKRGDHRWLGEARARPGVVTRGR
jgi:cellulose synthase/poly-beta-1,6-N-acetylglucosamine synthase-like glycosyltransferase